METENKDLIAKLEEYKNSMGSRMADRENIRMKCLEAALKYCEMRFQLGERFGDQEIMNIAEEFYKFVRGE